MPKIGIVNFTEQILQGASGISSSNLYEFEIGFGANTVLTEYYRKSHGTTLPVDDIYRSNLLCNEIQIPGVTYAATDVKSVHKGITQKLVSNKVYNELDVSFFCDQQSTPYKLFRSWMDLVMGQNIDSISNSAFENQPYRKQSSTYKTNAKAFAQNYYEDYTYDIVINKLEKGDLIGPKPGAAGKYANDFGVRLVNAYPYTLASVPYSAGPAQLVKVTVGFYYEYSSMYYNTRGGNF